MTAKVNPSYRELKTRLDEIMAWFDQDDLDIDQALEKYQQAADLIRQLEDYLGEKQLRIEKLKNIK